MNITFEEKENLLGQVKVELEPQDYLPPIQKKLKEVSKHAQMPGFRPGKVPVSLLQKMYGKSILFEEINKIINAEVSEYLKSNKIDLLFKYEIDSEKSSLEEIERFNFNQPIPLSFYLNVVRKPKLNINLSALLADTNFNAYKVIPSETEIEEFITDLSYEYGTQENAETIDLNDYVYGSLTNFENDSFKKPMRVNMWKTLMQVAEKFLGKKVDDTIELDIEVIREMQDSNAIHFLDDDFLTQENAPKTYIYTIKSINRITPKTIDNDFYSIASEYKAIDKETFFNYIKERLVKQYTFLTKETLYAQIIKKLIEKVDIPLPVEFIREKLTNMLESDLKTLTSEEQEKRLKQEIDTLKEHILSDDILNTNNITISEDDLKRQSIIEMKYRIAYIAQSPIMEFLNLDDIDLDVDENYQILEIAEKVLKNKQEYRKLYADVEKHYLQKIIFEQTPLTYKEVSIREFRKVQK